MRSSPFKTRSKTERPKAPEALGKAMKTQGLWGQAEQGVYCHLWRHRPAEKNQRNQRERSEDASPTRLLDTKSSYGNPLLKMATISMESELTHAMLVDLTT